MDSKKLDEILKGHRLWVAGLGGHRADLRGEDLRNAILCGANLRSANLRRIDLRGAYLGGACLWNADLRNADLRNADLRDADLRDADLSNTDLFSADLSGANLECAYMRNADLGGSAILRGANLKEASLCGANLIDTDLRNADLRDADLRSADFGGNTVLIGTNLSNAKLSGCNLPPLAAARLLVPPAEGGFTAFKKCRDGVIVTLHIPPSAKRSSATGRKCRASDAIVKEISSGKLTARSIRDENFIYTLGQTVHCHEWEPDRWVECGGGIHFYMSREEAEAHA